jgi:hypothetical protein
MRVHGRGGVAENVAEEGQGARVPLDELPPFCFISDQATAPVGHGGARGMGGVHGSEGGVGVREGGHINIKNKSYLLYQVGLGVVVD